MSTPKAAGAACVVNTKAFIKELEWATRFVETKTTIPILSNVLVEHAAGVINLTGNDLEIAGMTSLAPESDGARFAVAVPTKTLIRYLKKVDEPCVHLTVDDLKLTVSHGDASMTVHGMSKESYPEVPKVEPFIAKLAGLKLAIPRAKIAIAEEESRFTLNAALLELKQAGPDLLVATDGHRLSLAGISTNYDKAETFKALLPQKLLHELWWLEVDQADFYSSEPVIGKRKVKTKNGEHEEEYNELDRYLRLDCGDGRQIWARAIKGSFPDYGRVMPASFAHTVQLDTARFKKALERVSLCSDERSRCIRMSLENGKLTVSATLSDTGGAKDSMAAPGFSGPAWQSGFNANYLLDALRLMPETVELRCNRPESETDTKLFAAELGTDGWKYIAMPMRIV